jgi:hypothetical protein
MVVPVMKGNHTQREESENGLALVLRCPFPGRMQSRIEMSHPI